MSLFLFCIQGYDISVFFNRDQEEYKEKESRDKRKAEALIIALKGVKFRAAKVEVQKKNLEPVSVVAGWTL